MLKEIFERNSQIIGVQRDTLKQNIDGFEAMSPNLQNLMQTKFKCLDCKLLNNALQEVKRQRMLAKIKEDQYIFLQKYQPLDKRARTKQIEAQQLASKSSRGMKRPGSDSKVKRFGTSDKMSASQENSLGEEIAPGMKGESKMEDLLAHRPV